MELRRRFFPSRLFWSSYPGIAVFGVGGALTLAMFGTAMLAFRPTLEPWAPFIVGLGLSFLSHSRFTYVPDDYPWLVGWVYTMAALCLGLSAFTAYRKPALDRRVDAYLQRKIALDDSHSAGRDHSKQNK